jgi:hypothetical protein
MRMKPFRRAGAIVASATVVLGGTALASSAATAQASQSSSHHTRGIQHVLLISVDGMHQSDLDWYIANHPNSELARMATGGAEYSNAQTPDPSAPIRAARR